MRSELLRLAERWEQLVELDPADENAYQALMRRELARGNRHAAIQWYGRLRSVLRRELGVGPDMESEALYQACIGELGSAEPPFIGRQLELARIEALLKSEEASPASLVVVRGPAGIGKSALCRQVAVLAGQRGWVTVATVSGRGGEPYGSLVDLVVGLIDRDVQLRDRVAPTARAVLEQVMMRGHETATLTRQQIVGAVAQLLDAATASAPVLWIVDDVDQADDATVDSLLQLAAGPPGRILLLLGAREEGGRDLIATDIRGMARSGRVLLEDLDEMPDDDAAVLVQSVSTSPLAGGDVDRILHQAGGNPFFLVELARAAAEGSDLMTRESVVVARFVDLPAPQVAMLSRLALAGWDLDPAEVAALLASTDDDAFALLDVALVAGILMVAEGRYRFRHDIVRAALADRVAPHQRIAIHRDAARRLEDVGGSTIVDRPRIGSTATARKRRSPGSWMRDTRRCDSVPTAMRSRASRSFSRTTRATPRRCAWPPKRSMRSGAEERRLPTRRLLKSSPSRPMTFGPSKRWLSSSWATSTVPCRR